jgi:uracil-DNA glycosylase
MKTIKLTMSRATENLLVDVRACTLCAESLPLGPRPIVQVHPQARILIAGQAPGSKVHESGIPFDDASGNRLREWMGIGKDTFYDASKVAILPMGFCYPGTGKSGDLPPRPECAATWRKKLLAQMPHIQLTLVIGQYAQAWHLSDAKQDSLTDIVKAWRDYWPVMLPLPHPSPRNNIWLKRNEWFEDDVLPALRSRVAEMQL